MASSFKKGVAKINEKWRKAGYPAQFVCSKRCQVSYQPKSVFSSCSDKSFWSKEPFILVEVCTRFAYA